MEKTRFGRKEAKKTFKDLLCVGLLALAACEPEKVDVPVTVMPTVGPTATKEMTATPVVEKESDKKISTADIALAKMMILEINKFRMENSLPPLALNPTLMNMAFMRARDMGKRDYFGHVIPAQGDKKDMIPSEFAEELGYMSYGGENIAAGQSTLEEAMSAFRLSILHRGTMLNPKLVDVGTGYYLDANDQPNIHNYIDNTFGQGPYIRYWVQEYGTGADCARRTLIVNNGEEVFAPGQEVIISLNTGEINNVNFTLQTPDGTEKSVIGWWVKTTLPDNMGENTFVANYEIAGCPKQETRTTVKIR